MNEEESKPHHVGERLSLKGQSCTIRYIGPVSGKAGAWLGVEWDDSDRGKHDGTFEGIKYFECRSRSKTVASFLRPTQPWDQPRSFLAALREKYMDDFHQHEVDVVYISGKQAEEIGFEKFAQRQSRLRGIHVLVLDHMRIKSSSAGLVEDNDGRIIQELCADITELDLGGNLFEGFDEILRLCTLMPKLRVLTLDANRFDPDTFHAYDQLSSIETIRTLGLSRMLLSPEEVKQVLSFFPKLQTLTFAGNEINKPLRFQLPPNVSTLDLSDNQLSSLQDLRDLSINCPGTIILKRNAIHTVEIPKQQEFRATELDLTYNAINNWTFFNNITTTTFPNLRHLRVTGNPLYQNLISAEGKSLAPEDGYMLNIARVPQLEYLNYARITEKERLNAETYYLNQIGIEISRAVEGEEAAVLARHPRYRELCDEYGEPSIQRRPRKEEIDLNSLAAKLVTITFTFVPHIPGRHPQSWTEELPKSLNTYSVLGIVGKRLGIIPLHLRLVLRLDERDPIGKEGEYRGPEWWDSSDDEAEERNDGEDWVRRKVEMMPGTRSIGTYVEAMEASVTVETRKGYEGRLP